MPESYSAQLDRVQRQIAAIEERGQSVSDDGVSLTRADLQTLYDREERLRGKVKRETRGGRIKSQRIRRC